MRDEGIVSSRPLSESEAYRNLRNSNVPHETALAVVLALRAEEIVRDGYAEPEDEEIVALAQDYLRLVRRDEIEKWLRENTGQEKNPKADPDCPSCHGSGWAVIRKKGITFAGGRCRCVAGEGGVWAVDDE